MDIRLAPLCAATFHKILRNMGVITEYDAASDILDVYTDYSDMLYTDIYDKIYCKTKNDPPDIVPISVTTILNVCLNYAQNNMKRAVDLEFRDRLQTLIDRVTSIAMQLPLPNGEPTTYLNAGMTFREQYLELIQHGVDADDIFNYYRTTCTDMDLHNKIDDRLDEMHTEQPKTGMPIELMIFSEYLYKKYKVNPVDLEFLFALVMYGYEDAIQNTAKLTVEQLRPTPKKVSPKVIDISNVCEIHRDEE